MKNFFNIFSVIFFSMALAMGMGISPLHAGAGVVSIAVIKSIVTPTISGVALLDAADVSALTAYAGKKYRALIWTLVSELHVARDVMMRSNIKSKELIGKLNILDGLRPFSSDEEFGTAGGDLIYTDRYLEVNGAKRELKFDLSAYENTYLEEFQSAGSGASKAAQPSQIPFAQWTWMRILETIRAELNNKTAFHGFDKADAVAWAGDPATYDAGDYVTFTVSGRIEWFKCLATTLVDESPATHPAKWQNVTAQAITRGFGTVIADELAASNITALSTGAITDSASTKAVFDQIFRSMPVEYRDQGAGIIQLCSYTDFNFLIDAYRDQMFYLDKKGNPAESQNGMYLPGSNNRCYIKPCTWMQNTRRIIASPMVISGGQPKAASLLMGTDKMADMNDVSIVQNELWKFKAGVKFKIGFEVANLDEIRVNNQV